MIYLYNKLNKYTCNTCEGEIVTIEREPGVTPMMIDCRATEGCEGLMMSWGYQIHYDVTPTWEWVKPDINLLKNYKKKNPALFEHFKLGGLYLRKIEP